MSKEQRLVTFSLLFAFAILAPLYQLIDWCMVFDVMNFYFVDDIGSNIEHSHEATEQAKSQLAKASNTQRSNSSLVYISFLTNDWIVGSKSQLPPFV